MTRQRRSFSSDFKAKVAVEAIRGQHSVAQIAQQYSVHPNEVSGWKNQALEHLRGAFADGRRTVETDHEALEARLNQQIGQLKVELDWLKKLPASSTEVRRQWIDPKLATISVARQCELIGLSRSSYYYVPVPETAQDLYLMRLIDEQYTRTPFYGVPRMTVHLRNHGQVVNHKRVARLMKAMGLAAIYPRPRRSADRIEHRVYPYLLGDHAVTAPNDAWATDITYIRLLRGFVYLVAVMDWFSRYVLAWAVSTSLESDFCVGALDWALQAGQPSLFNTDQGARESPSRRILLGSGSFRA